MSHERTKKGARVTARELLWCYIKSTGRTVFRVSDVVAWLRRHGVKVTDGAIRSALWRLARGRKVAKKVGKGLWAVDVVGLASLISGESDVCISLSRGVAVNVNSKRSEGVNEQLLRIAINLLRMAMEQ